MAEVGSFTSRGHAEMAAGMLEAHGIAGRVLGDDAGGAVPHVAVGAHGYRIAVADADAEEARVLLVGETTHDEEGAATAIVSPLLRKATMRVVAGVVVAVVVLGVLLGELL